MAFPIVVNGGVSSGEEPCRYGPFQVGANLYLILTRWTGSDLLMVAWKSTDNGLTWAEKDTAGSPAIDSDGSGFLRNYTCCQSTAVPSKIYAVTFARVTDGQFAIRAFDCALDAWGLIIAVTDAPTDNPIEAQNAYLTCCYRASDDSVVVVAAGDTVNLNTVDHIITAFSVFGIVSETFSTWADLSYDDFAAINNWAQVPIACECGSDGLVRVIMQQLTWPGDGIPSPGGLSGSGSFIVPPDCLALINIEVWGGGGGAGGSMTSSDGFPGGGGGGYSADAGPISVTPGDSISYVVGAGGTWGVAGGDSNFAGISAGGGTAGDNSPTGDGGTGGAGDFTGGAGGKTGVTLVITGGGGGGSGGPGANGGDGGDGPDSGFGGGAGGVSASGFGGTGGGTRSGDLHGEAGGDGEGPGGGAGGDSSEAGLEPPHPPTSQGGIGAVTFSFIPFRAGDPGRLWQQAIKPDNTLGTLAQITEAIPPVNLAVNFQPISLDLKTAAGYVEIALTGVEATGYGNMLVGRAPNADPLIFDFATISTGAANGVDPTPALSLSGADKYLQYESSTISIATFKWRKNGGTASDFGTWDPYSRLQAAYFNGQHITFGTPTFAGGGIAIVDVGAALSYTAVQGGLAGNNIFFIFNPVSGGGTSVSVSNSDFEQYVITVTVGYDPMTQILEAGDWAAIAAMINSSAAGIVFATGTSYNLLASGGGALTGGSAGGGLGQYYWAGPGGTPKRNYVSSGGGLVAKGNFVA